MKRITILGSTGSVGTQTLAVMERFPDRFQVVGLAAGRNTEVLAQQVSRFHPRVVSVVDETAAEQLQGALRTAGVETLPAIEVGSAGACTVAAQDSDLVMSAMVGAAGLAPTLVAVDRGAAIALANKEILVMAGELVTRRAEKSGAHLLPVDSEHAAVHQALGNRPLHEVRRLILTASGGPFLNTPRAELEHVTPERAVKHPRWDMGAKISVDSATLLNKGFEVHEARWLFGIESDRIDIVVHPESIVHALVEFIDGSMNAQLAVPDMAGPIAYALAWPDRLPSAMEPLDLASIGTLHFEDPDLDRFPALALALQACRTAGTAPAVLAAADEIAVEAFLAGQIPFLAIPEVLRGALERVESVPVTSLEVVEEADRLARKAAQETVRSVAA